MKTSILTLALTLSLTATMAHADKVGNDGGFATPKTKNEVAHLDDFHKILWAYNHSRFNDAKSAAGVWAGFIVTHYKDKDQNGKVVALKLDTSALGLKYEDGGPLLESRLASATLVEYLGYDKKTDNLYAGGYSLSQIPDVIHSLNPDSSEVKWGGSELTTEFSNGVVTFHQIKGAIVGLRRPEKDGTCKPGGPVVAVDGVCAAYYFYQRVPTNSFPVANE